jgi:hypothetical protein
MNQLVARFTDGRMVKGTTLDFSPAKELFHVVAADAPVTSPAEEVPTLAIRTDDLKALFFVKDLAGDPQHVERQDFDGPPPAGGRRVKAAFTDGEVLFGTTTSYQPGLPGFFLVPADPESNIVRCYVVAAATQEISLL